MLKYVLALLALVVVPLAPVFADEGYIPYFPDFIEPDGIGFRGPASIKASNCWANYECKSGESLPEQKTSSQAISFTRSSPITFEYRKNYLFKKLFYTKVFADFGQTLTDGTLRYHDNWYHDMNINSYPFLRKFLTAEEKSKLSSLRLDDAYRIFNLQTEVKFISLGVGFGLDLWLLEGSWGPFLMLHDTSVSLRACKTLDFGADAEDIDSMFLIPHTCTEYPNEIINLDKKRYFGFAIGSITELSLVFLQTENWRISMDTTTTNFNLYMDSEFKQISYRGLYFYPEYRASSTLNCTGGKYIYGRGKEKSGGEVQDIDCRNLKGEDHRKSSDYTYGLKITYYFR